MIGTNIVGIVKKDTFSYPDKEELFRPGERYPEYIFEEYSTLRNEIYDAVRESIKIMGLDRGRIGEKEWNPFGDFIMPGMTVLIKPNLVMDINRAGAGTDCLYTHPSVVAPIIDYTIKALGGRGKIIVGDAPVQECNFEKLIQDSGYQELISYYQKKGVDILLLDLRGAASVEKNGIYHLEERTNSKGTIIDLKQDSEFYELDEEIKKRLRITNYNPETVSGHHTGDTNEYMISSCVMDADVIINVPKPKTHRIAGMTAALKNFVGINVRKEYLPHHTMGDHSTGGDESDIDGVILNLRSKCLDNKNRCQDREKYIQAKIWLLGVRIFSLAIKNKSKYREGCWYGNNTICKTIADINKIVYYADQNGEMQKKPQRKVLIIADMIVSGQGNGPLNPHPKNVGMIVIGDNPVYVDETIAKVMGFDSRKIPTLQLIKKTTGKKYSLLEKDEEILIRSNTNYDGKRLDEIVMENIDAFEPASGWKDHIELIDKGVKTL